MDRPQHALGEGVTGSGHPLPYLMEKT
jgi:hypothetical protein